MTDAGDDAFGLEDAALIETDSDSAGVWLPYGWTPSLC